MDERQGSGRGVFFTVYRLLFVLLSFGIGLFFTLWGGKLLSLGGSAWYLLAGLAYLHRRRLSHPQPLCPAFCHSDFPVDPLLGAV